MAQKAANFVLTEMREDGNLLRTHRNGNSHIPAYLDDYIFMIGGLLDLYEADFDIRWLGEAEALADRLVRDYWDETHGGFYFALGGPGRPDHPHEAKLRWCHPLWELNGRSRSTPSRHANWPRGPPAARLHHPQAGKLRARRKSPRRNGPDPRGAGFAPARPLRLPSSVRTPQKPTHCLPLPGSTTYRTPCLPVSTRLRTPQQRRRSRFPS